MKNTYWNSNGKHQAALTALHDLIPAMGACEFPRSKNRNLEKLRKAINCYYDLYNNGLINRKQEFYRVFGLRASYYGCYRTGYGTLYNKIEPMMDQFIENAAHEQGLAHLLNKEEAVA